ncbi:MAG: metal-dependent hydrolase [Flavobacterium sp. BFFFF2]|nr:MAG: metal-dependent hydrolase [Flavobacterium sp. BFFFF2]
MKNNVATRLAVLLETIPTLLLAFSEEEFSQKPSPNKWSKKEILGHLIDSAANNHQRLIRTQYENVPVLFYDQNKWNELNHYQQLTANHLIQFWTIYNQHVLEIIKRMPQAHLGKECQVGNGEMVTIQYIMDDYVLHLEHHLKQIINDVI